MVGNNIPGEMFLLGAQAALVEVLPERLVREHSHESFAQFLAVPLRHLNHSRLGDRMGSMRTAVGHKREPASDARNRAPALGGDLPPNEQQRIGVRQGSGNLLWRKDPERRELYFHAAERLSESCLSLFLPSAQGDEAERL